jgi:hypothetical protein
MSFNHRDWKPAEQLFEEAGVMYSWYQVDGFTAYQYTLTYEPLNVVVPRTVYIMGSQGDFNTLLAHWNRGDDGWDGWICS